MFCHLFISILNVVRFMNRFFKGTKQLLFPINISMTLMNIYELSAVHKMLASYRVILFSMLFQKAQMNYHEIFQNHKHFANVCILFSKLYIGKKSNKTSYRYLFPTIWRTMCKTSFQFLSAHTDFRV